MMPKLLTAELKTLTEYYNDSGSLACITYLTHYTKIEDLKNNRTAFTYLEHD